MARPICEFFLGKVLSDAKSGIDKEARFVVPAEMGQYINSADILLNAEENSPGAQGQDMGVGSEEDYNLQPSEYIGPESTPLTEEDKKPVAPPRKDTITKSSPATTPKGTPIGAPKEEPAKKKGLFNRIRNNN
jgi:penicillin-binding protein 1A